MAVSVVEVGVSTLTSGSSRTVTLSSTPTAGDVLVMIAVHSSTRTLSTVSGCGTVNGDWTVHHDVSSTVSMSFATATTANASGTITVTFSASRTGTVRVYIVRGLTSPTIAATSTTATGTSLLNGPSDTVGLGDIAIDALINNGTAAETTWTRTSFTDDPNGVVSNGTNVTGGTTYWIPGSSGTAQTTAQTSVSRTSRVGQITLKSASSTGSATLALSGTATPGVADTASAALALSGTATTAADDTATAVLALSGTATASGGGAATASAALTFAATATPVAATTSTAALTLGATAATGATASATASLVLSGVASLGSPNITAPVVYGARIVGSESSETPVDSPILTAPIVFGARVRSPLTPVPPPVGVLVEWPLERQAHIMPALSAANPRYRAELDYDVEYDTIGRTHVFVDGEDYTYKRGVPAQFDDYTSSVPMGPASASIKLPQFKPWDVSGEGDWTALDMSQDPALEIAIVRPDDSVEQVWEGFLSSDEEASGRGREDYTFKAEGMFLQAAHQLWDPPVYMEPTDPGHLIADALNGVVHRRWNAIPRFDTGLIPVIERGEQGQTVWQYVQDLLSKAWTEDERQLTLQRIAPYTYRLGWKKVADDVDWTVTKGAPGIECNLRTDQSNRRDALYGRGVAPDGGVWGNFFFPGLDLYAIPRYPFDDTSTNIDVGTTDAETDTGNGVTLWQRRMRELGYNVTVDGVMNSADTKWVTKVQQDRGVTVDGSLGPQTWNATFDRGMTVLDLTRIRRPLATRNDVEPFLYNANGSKVGANPADNPKKIRHAAPEVDFGAGWKKTAAFPVAAQMRARDEDPGVQGTITLLTDPHETGSSRFDIKPGDNVKVIGHRGDVVLQVSEVSVSDLAVTLTVDSRARDALSVLAILERDRDARRDMSSRTARSSNKAGLDNDATVQYESESKAGTVPRTAINGDSGLWTVIPIFVSQVGVAKVEFLANSPKAEMVIALFEKPITANKLASFVPDPLSDDNDWYDNVETLEESHGLMEIFGTPSEPGGYWPRQKTGTHAGPLTGKMRDRSSALYSSKYGGFVWVAMFTSQSTWVSGRMYPAVPT